MSNDLQKSAQVYEVMMNRMIDRGPDNAYILSNYAIYMCYNEVYDESDFLVVLNIIHRAKAAGFLNYQLPFLELGFYFAATLELDCILSLRKEASLCYMNYAVFLQFFGSCLKYKNSLSYFTSNRNCTGVSHQLQTKMEAENAVYSSWRVSDNDVTPEDLELSEQYYLKALEANPHDSKIISNFDLMLTYLKGEHVTAAERFRDYQQQKHVFKKTTL